MIKETEKDRRLKMFEEFFHIFDQWMTLHEDGISLDMILKRKGYKRVAIYGMGSMAMHVIQELRDSSVEVLYVIERIKESYYTEIEVKTLGDTDLQEVDMIICTLELKDKEIRKELYERTNAKICSLSEVVFDNIENREKN